MRPPTPLAFTRPAPTYCHPPDARSGLDTQGDSLDEATDNARAALELYVEGLREDGRPIDTGVVRRKLPLPA